MKKTISLPIAIVIVVFAGLMGLIAWQYGLIPLQKNIGKPEPQIAPASHLDIEATVVSLFLDDLYSDCEEPEVCPRDRVTLIIDKVDRSGDPNNTINLDVGYEVEFHLEYSARPAKLRNDLPPTCSDGLIFESGSCVREDCEGPECSVSSPQYGEKPAELEDGYIVYHLPQQTDEVTEKILSGLEEGSEIKIRIWQPALMNKDAYISYAKALDFFASKNLHSNLLSKEKVLAQNNQNKLVVFAYLVELYYLDNGKYPTDATFSSLVTTLKSSNHFDDTLKYNESDFTYTSPGAGYFEIGHKDEISGQTSKIVVGVKADATTSLGASVQAWTIKVKDKKIKLEFVGDLINSFESLLPLRP